MDQSKVEALRLQTLPVAFDLGYKDAYGNKSLARWAYVRALLFLGYYRHGVQTGNDVEIRLIKEYMDHLIEEGIEETINFDYASTDQISMANALLYLYDVYQDEKYRELADRFYESMMRFPRTEQGNFWHKENYPNQVWLDGLYMAHLFYTGYVKRFRKEKDYSDTLSQLKSVRNLCYVEDEQVYYHACDTKKLMFWADPETGVSPNVWLRSVGWLAMALVEVYETVQDAVSEEERQALKDQLLELYEGMMPHMREDMWFQVFNREDGENNYLETSGTLMLAYAMMKGARLGMLDQEWKETGRKVYESVLRHYLKEENGRIVLGGICASAGLGTNPDTGIHRSGDYAYYTTQEKVIPNNGHGIGALFLAENEYLLTL
ncbi:MAG: glycoside hydrolase family 88 protein [Lachnospiraceae bacterium]|nr:glycoside hydrolase family 88 protein [Lachnospiraceae bacterium]